MKHLWLKITQDEYELPLVVGRSADELARMCGVGKEVIFRWIKRQNDNPKVKPRYIRVDYTDEEFESSGG